MPESAQPDGRGIARARFGAANRAASLTAAAAPAMVAGHLFLNGMIAPGSGALFFAISFVLIGSRRAGAQVIPLLFLGAAYTLAATLALGSDGLGCVFPLALLPIACLAPGFDRSMRTTLAVSAIALVIGLAALVENGLLQSGDVTVVKLTHVGVVAVILAEMLLANADLASEFEARLEDSSRSIGELARADHLTQISNRRHMEEMLAAEISRARRSAEPLCIAMVDIDGLKNVNASHGHEIGDTVLRVAASTLQKALRPYDHVGRWVGEEFLIVMPRTTLMAAGMVCDRLRILIQHSARSQDGLIPVFTATFGVSAVDFEAPFEATVVRADATMHFAKRDGGNAVAVVDERGPAMLADAVAQ